MQRISQFMLRAARSVRRRLLNKTIYKGWGERGLANMQAITATHPLMINVETTTVCNARCSFCAYPKVPRPKTIMDMALFEKICAEVDAYGGYLGLSPLMSDPLTDPMLFERLALGDKYRRVKFHMFTNGIRLIKLTDDKLATILCRLSHMNISLGGFDAKDYEAMFGVNKFDDVLAGLYRLAAIKKRIGSKCHLALHIRTHNRAKVTSHPERAKLIKAGLQCDDILDTFSNWGGVIKPDHLPKGASLVERDNSRETTPCLIPATQAMVLPDGKVAACTCMDSKGASIVGDATTAKVADIWVGEKALEFRNSFTTGKVPDLCKTCAYYTDSQAFFRDPRFAKFKLGQNMWTA